MKWESAGDKRESESMLTRHVYHHRLAMKGLLFSLLISSVVAATYAEDTVTELHVETIEKPSECKREARRGDMLTMHYRGSLTDGTEFDSRSDPTPCPLLNTLFFLQLESERAFQISTGSRAGDKRLGPGSGRSL